MRRVLGLGLLGAIGCKPVDVSDRPGPQLVGSRIERTIIDNTRETPDLGAQEPRDEREIRIVIWTGAFETPDTRPIVFLAHGVDGHPEFFEGAARVLADAGHMVVAPAFPSTNRDNAAGYAGIADLVNQPGDLAVVLDVLTDAVANPDDALYQQFDPSRVGAVGHSLGSATVLAWTRHDCCRDDRVGAVAQISTPQSLMVTFGDDDVDPTGPPVVLLHGEDDGTVPIGESETLAERFDDERAFVRLAGVTHSELIEGTADVPARHVTEAVLMGLFSEVLAGEAGALDAALDGVESDIVQVLR